MSVPRNEKDLYKVLGVEKGADKDDIRKAYFRLSKTHHPDKGGSEEDFKAVSRAYDVLSDEKKRQFYDMTGDVDGEGGGQQQQQGNPFGGGHPFGGGGFPFDMGGMFGGMFGGGQQQQGPKQKRQKAPPKVHEVNLRLSDFYYGRTIQFQFERQKFCSGCKGEGCTSFVPCSTCQGRGIVEQQIMIGPGMAAINRMPCPPCRGEGRQNGAACGQCKGKKFTAQEKSLDVKIEPGMKVGEVLVFVKECSDNHDYHEAGDVHIVLNEADETTVFKREGTTLHTKMQLTLAECLLGTQRTLPGHPAHSDGLVVDIPPGVMSGTTHTVEGKGMPQRQSGGYGNLVCHITVVLTDSEKEKLRSQTTMIRSLFT